MVRHLVSFNLYYYDGFFFPVLVSPDLGTAG